MAIFKPETSNGTFTNYHGVCEFGLLGFKDRAAEFDWSDVFIEVSIQQKDSDYERTLQIKGSFEKEGNKITGGSVLKRMYQFFDELGCSAGINVKGEWEDESGNKIEDIAGYLNEKFSSISIPDSPPDDFPYIAYLYKEQPKVPGGKSYTRVFSKVYQNKEDNKAKLEDDVNWMKSKGYLKEMTDEVSNKTEMSGSGLSNL